MDSYADLLNLNFMYSLRTGNLLTDMMIAALLPLVSGFVAYVTRTWWPQLINRWLAYFSNVDSTSASFRTTDDSSSLYYGHTMRVALSTYVTKVLKPRFDVAELKYITIPGKKVHEAETYTQALKEYCFVDAGPAKEVPMELTHDLELKQADANAGGENGDGGNGDGDASKNSKKVNDTIFTLVQFRPSFPMLRKIMDRWEGTAAATEAEVATRDAEAAKAVAELEEATQRNGDAIQLLLDRAVAHYRSEYKQAGISTDRYLYQPLLTKPKMSFGVSAADEKSGSEGAMDCNRYLLRSEKTFNSLFFPDKARLLQLIDNFESKSGKYAIPGYPQKLVLLLYGPPGTGKTSLAKAVAAYTKRDLFAISLSRIRSNEELLKYMFSGHVRVKNEKQKDEDHYRYRSNNDDNAPKELDPTKLVYILEDVDATNAVVLKDEEAEAEAAAAAAEVKKAKKSKKPAKAQKPATKKAAVSVASDKEEEEEEEENEKEEKEDEGEGEESEKEEKEDEGEGEEDEGEGEEAEKSEKTEAGDDTNADSDDAAKSTHNDTASQSTECEVVAVDGNKGKAARKLTIEGLTNALNGVLDFPQRIVIMTTNHIEKLHPSLLRPGVVTMKLHMHNFDADCAAAMVQHYFSHTGIVPSQLEELRALVERASTKASKVDATAATSEDGRSSNSAAAELKGFSPAELEQRCAECETVDELLDALRQGSRVNTF